MKFGLKNVKGTATNRLKAWNIYKVVLRDITYEHGTSKAGKDWQGMKVSFAGEAGSFDKTFFCPSEGGDERMSGESNGRKWTLPSNVEVFERTLAHLGENLSPEKYKKFKGLEFNLPDEFEKLVVTFKEAMSPAINKETSLKLIANKQGYADIPNFVSISSKTDEAFISNNWIGKNVTFSDREMENMRKAKEAKPSEAPAIDAAKDSADLNFDI
jgi:hypothetical protein